VDFWGKKSLNLVKADKSHTHHPPYGDSSPKKGKAPVALTFRSELAAQRQGTPRWVEVVPGGDSPNLP